MLRGSAKDKCCGLQATRRLSATAHQRRRSLRLGAYLLVPAMLGLALAMLGGCGATGNLVSSTQPVSTAKDDAEVSSRTVEAAPGFGRASTSKKGSLLYFPHVEIKWDAQGRVRQDTFLELTNDFPQDVQVQLYLVNGDPPTEAVLAGQPPMLVERPHTGWNWVDVQLVLTGNEPTYWSLLDGQPKGVSSLMLLDPGDPPGRPDTDPLNMGGRVMRGYVVGWAVAAGGHEIVWNHLSGNAVVIDYNDSAAWEYQAWAFQARGVTQGQEPLSCLQVNLDSGQCIDKDISRGTLDMDGFEYDTCPDRLQFSFRAAGSLLNGGNGPGSLPVIVDSALTLGVMDMDFRQDGNGPVSTKARFDIWNQNEVRFSGTEKCLTCWDSAWLANYTTSGVPNHFLVNNLQTEIGVARVDGMGSAVCDKNGVDTQDVPLLGVLYKTLRFAVTTVTTTNTDQTGNGTTTVIDQAGRTIGGQGYEAAGLRYDIIAPPQEAQGGQ